jgi:preprotein translocase subunit SecA
MYGKLAGMTGTADTEAFEFQQIYHLETVVIPTHLAMVRKDENDLVFRTLQEKVDAIIADVKDCHDRGQPVLVGTTSIENSEMLSGHLDKAGLKHEVLNAKQHAREAEIVAQAGRPQAITIATNMAGRGTDIVLGGQIEPTILRMRDDTSMADDERERTIATMRGEWQERHNAVVKSGGLHIVGTERHESRRIDNQLRGRSGRQGDPGSSRFYLSLEDPLLKIFGGERLGVIMQKLKMPEGEPIEHTIVNRSLEKAQHRVESRNFDIRKALLEYDDVANDQRRVIYQQRNDLVDATDVADTIANMVRGEMETTVRRYVPAESVEEQWDLPGLETALAGDFQLKVDAREWVKDPEVIDEGIRDRVVEAALAAWKEREASAGGEIMRSFERSLMLQTLDHHWRDHLAQLDQLRQGIHLRGYAQKNPKQEYKREAFELFSDMLDRVKQDVVKVMLTVQVKTQQDVEAVEAPAEVSNVQYQHADYEEALAAPAGDDGAGTAVAAQPFVRAGGKVGRNDPCPCGSGKKYKQCHGRLA